MVRDVVAEQAQKMTVVDDDDMVEELAPDAADPTFGDAVVFWMPLAGRVDMEPACLCVLEKSVDDVRLAWVRGVDDRLRAVRDDDMEHTLVELPRDLARLDRGLRALLPARVDELVPRQVRREDPRAELATLPA